MHSAPPRLGRSIIVLELELDRQFPPKWVRVTTSIPGREGQFARVWPLEDGTLAQRTYEDLTAAVQDQLVLGITLGGHGVQQELPT